MRVLFQRAIITALALLLNMALQWVPERWSATLVAAGGLLVGKFVRRLPASLRAWAEAAILSTVIEMQRLRVQAATLSHRLIEGDTIGAQRMAARLLAREEVPEDPHALASEGILVVADGMAARVVAPLFYYWVGGVPAAMLYRLIIENKGLLGAQREEILRWIQAVPSRLTAALVVAAAYLRKREGADIRGLRRWEPVWASRVAHRAAMARALSVALREGDAVLDEGCRSPRPEDIARAVHLMRLGIVLGASVSLAVSWLLSRRRR